MTNTESPRPIENHDGTLVFTGVGIALLRDVSAASNLAMKITRGMQLTRSLPGRTPITIANSISSQLDWEMITAATKVKAPSNWAGKRTNAGALLDLVLFLVVVYDWQPLPSVREALDADKLGAVLRKAAKIRTALLAVLAAEQVLVDAQS
jgi:hypothetical protein